MSSLLHRYVASWVRTQYRKRSKTAAYSFFRRSSASASNSSSSSRLLTPLMIALRGRPGSCPNRGFSVTERARRAVGARNLARPGGDAARRGPARRSSRRRRAAGRGRSCAAPIAGRSARGRGGARRRASDRAVGARSAASRAQRPRSGTSPGPRSPTAPSRSPWKGVRLRSALPPLGSGARDRRDSTRGRHMRSSWPLDDHCGVLDAKTRGLLAHAQLQPRRFELLVECIRNRRRERLEQVEAVRLAQLADLRGNVRVVERALEVVVRAAIADFQLHVPEEQLAVALLLFVRAVVAEYLEPVQLDNQPRTAFAAASASTCSRTSCTRRIVAPRSNADTAAPTDAAVVPTFAFGSPRIRASELLRENPIRIGRPIATSSSRRRTSSKFCSTVLPKPMPGSKQTSSSRTPAATANASRSSRNAFTSETTSS